MSEKQLQTKIMNALHAHPSVAFAYVNTCGTVKIRGYYTTLGFPGLSDITGMMTDGRFFAIEVKVGKNQPSKEQIEFIDMVNKNNGKAGAVWSVEEALAMFN